MALTKIGQISIITGIALILAGCEEGGESRLFQPRDKGGENAGTSMPRGSGKRGAQEIEAPKVFQVTDEGLWDGRPSLGGVWVAHPSVKDPQRVIIRNQANGKSVNGALFRRERENPGPEFQVSSDASAALGMLAGQPANLKVTALVREEAPEPVVKPEPVAEEAPTTEAAPAKPAETPKAASKPPTGGGDIEQTTLDPIASAAAAIEAADGDTGTLATKPARSSKPLFALSKPYVQLAAFDTEADATAAADTLREAGLEPVVKEQNTGENSVWRVIVGPAASRKERTALKKQVKGLGFAKTIFVKE